MRPRNPMEAMLAAETITAHHVIMDCFRLALRTDTDPAAAARARSNAAMLSRVRLANLRTLEQAHAPPPAAVRPAAPARRKPDAAERSEVAEAPAMPAEPAQQPPPVQPPRYLPRDRFGEPIELWRWEDMTMSQRRAAFAEPGHTVELDEALAEEAAAIAAQAMLPADLVEPEPGAEIPVTPPPAAPC